MTYSFSESEMLALQTLEPYLGIEGSGAYYVNLTVVKGREMEEEFAPGTYAELSEAVRVLYPEGHCEYHETALKLVLIHPERNPETFTEISNIRRGREWRERHDNVWVGVSHGEIWLGVDDGTEYGYERSIPQLWQEGLGDVLAPKGRIYGFNDEEVSALATVVFLMEMTLDELSGDELVLDLNREFGRHVPEMMSAAVETLASASLIRQDAPGVYLVAREDNPKLFFMINQIYDAVVEHAQHQELHEPPFSFLDRIQLPGWLASVAELWTGAGQQANDLPDVEPGRSRGRPS